MGKAEDFFEEKWQELLKMYKEDWKYNLKNHGKVALKYVPEHFYSEGDVEAIFSCLLRNKLIKEKYYNSEYVVRNQLRFSPGDYEGFNISEKFAKCEQVHRNSHSANTLYFTLDCFTNFTSLYILHVKLYGMLYTYL